MAKGVGLRLLSRRGSWVQIPPPAPLPLFQSFVGKLHLRTGIQSLISIFGNNLCEPAPFCCAILFACCEIEYRYNLGRLGSSVFERCCSSKSVLNASAKERKNNSEGTTILWFIFPFLRRVSAFSSCFCSLMKAYLCPRQV